MLRSLLDSPELSVRRDALYALALLGSSGDAKLFADILADAAADSHHRYLAALALGKIGGDGVVASLESAATGAPAELRRGIVTALGHTRSPLAVPAIIRVVDDDTHNQMCGSLRLLTHRRWCEGAPVDHAARARRWLRDWQDRAPGTLIHGLEDCDVLEQKIGEYTSYRTRGSCRNRPFAQPPHHRGLPRLFRFGRRLVHRC